MTDTTDPQADRCPGCQHPQHAPGAECDQRVEHDGQRNWHLCLCLNRQHADHPCSPLMTCQGGALGYGDVWYLQRGHSLSSANGVITPEVLKTTPAAPAAASSAPADRAAILREAADIAEDQRQFEPAFGARKSAQVSENVGILRVAEELRRMADEAQQPTPCSQPNPCEDGGDPCTTHEREQAHAEGDHGLCGADPCSGCRYVPCGNCQPADEAQADDDPTESVLYEVVGNWGVDGADSAEAARAAVAKWLRAYPTSGAHAQQRIHREWPDGSEFYGPWTDLPEQPAAVSQPGKEA